RAADPTRGPGGEARLLLPVKLDLDPALGVDVDLAAADDRGRLRAEHPWLWSSGERTERHVGRHAGEVVAVWALATERVRGLDDDPLARSLVVEALDGEAIARPRGAGVALAAGGRAGHAQRLDEVAGPLAEVVTAEPSIAV